MSLRTLPIIGSLALPSVLLMSMLIGCGGTSIDELKFNEIQVLGSHNSYKLALDPELQLAFEKSFPAIAPGLEYTHLSLTEQLDFGLRAFELDVYYDPDGGRYASPLGLSLIAQASGFDPDKRMLQTGFKVLHAQDLDFRSNCLLLSDCLSELKNWSDKNSGHLPIMVSINAKDAESRQAGFVVPLLFDVSAWDALDAELELGLGEKLILPREIQGDAKSLNARITGKGWPQLSALVGRFMFVLDEKVEKNSSYLDTRKEAIMFLNMPEGTPHSAVRIVNEPVKELELIQNLVQEGYLVRTRADANTSEARTNDTLRREAAWASGAHFVSTDYYQRSTLFDSNYSVQPELLELNQEHTVDTDLTDLYFRCNPVTAAFLCAEIQPDPAH